MHIPDGVLTAPVVGGTIAFSLLGVATAARRLRANLPDEKVALVGVLGAFVFAAQMVNFPVPGSPVSTHLMGSGLLAILLGPAAAIVSLAAVLLIQALLFQDGGLLALGANTLNVAILGSGVAALVYRLIGRSPASAWVSLVALT